MLKQENGLAKTLQLELIAWKDHCSLGGGWKSSGYTIEELRPVYIESVGWVLKEKKTYLILASHLTASGELQGELCILKSDIIKRKKLRDFTKSNNT